MRGAGAIVAALVLIMPCGAAAQSLDVRGWLDRPGVKLLAVEFYATWCKPCMAAVPKWKALHEKYRRDGLRLVVVATQDPEGACANPGWNPDDVICDNDGRIARALGADALPAAYLWSWQGNLLVRRGHVGEVHRAIRGWTRRTPRVDVEVTSLPDTSRLSKPELRVLLRAELHRSGKLTVVATREEQQKLDRIRAESFKGRYDEALQCEIGKDVSANSLLTARVTSGRRQQLQLTLLSAERGCLVASALVDWQPARARVSVAEAVSELVQKLRPAIQMPGTRRTSSRGLPPADRDISEVPSAWEPGQGVDEVIVHFESDPPGAVVMVDGKLLCQSTEGGCSKALTVGSHRIAMHLERYEERGEQATIEKGTRIKWKLKPNFGRLTVTSIPSGTDLRVNGKVVGTTPVTNHELAPGVYEAVIDDRCYYKKGRRVSLMRGDHKTLDLALSPRQGAIKVTAEDSKGNAVAADVFVDGARLGRTPGVLKVSVCAQQIVVKHPSHGVWTGALSIQEEQTTELPVVFSSGRGRPPRRGAESNRLVEFVFESPRGAVVSLDGEQIGVTPFRRTFPKCDEVVSFVFSKRGSEKTIQASLLRDTVVRARLEPHRSGRPGNQMVRVPAGEFFMGCSVRNRNCSGDAKPGRKVYLDAFEIDRTEVTVAAYAACVMAGPCSAPSDEWSYDWRRSDRDDHPIACVYWDQAKTYCESMGKRLPTEAEWEKAARGTDGRRYPWGDDKTFCRNAVIGIFGCPFVDTMAVGSKPKGASPYGALDMAGNVWEWVADYYDADYYAKSPRRNPTGPGRGSHHVIRGGSWGSENAQTSYRGRGRPGIRCDTLGFRCVRSSSSPSPLAP